MSEHDAEFPGTARGYTRVSTDEQRRTGISLEVQENQIKAYYDYKLAPLGYRWGGIYRDEAVSGFKLPFIRRPAGEKLHESLRHGDYVIFSKLDRGFRNGRDCDKMVHLWDEMGVNVKFLDIDIDTKSPFGRLLLRLLSAFAEWEYEIIRERNRSVAAWRVERKMPIGKRHARLGFKWAGPPGKKVQVPNGNDREIIDRIVEWRIAGSDFGDIAVHLQRMGLKMQDGRELTFRRVKQFFYNEVNHLVKDGVLLRYERRGGGPRYRLVLEWALDKLPPERLERLLALYSSLGRKINDHLEAQ